MEAIHRHIDANPEDFDARKILGDKLDDIGSNLADGYRAIGGLRLFGASNDDYAPGKHWWTLWSVSAGGYVNYVHQNYDRERHNRAIPSDWFDELRGGGYFIGTARILSGGYGWRDYRSRRALEDALALAFSKLPEGRRRELLKMKVGDA